MASSPALMSNRLLSFISGPQNMTYLIQPKHFNVKYPRHATNHDLLHENTNFQRPLTEATSMSYFLQRVRYTAICRTIVDNLLSADTPIENVDYDLIIHLDSKIDKFMKELPPFFRLDEKSRLASQEIDRKLPQIPVQRYILNLSVQCRRIRLHQPFLLRRSLNHRYAYSRETCLRSARAVILVKKLLEDKASLLGTSHRRLFSIIYHLFLATVVLVMDLCFNADENCVERQRAEVREACRMLDGCASQSQLAGTYLKSLKEVMRKHNINMLHTESEISRGYDSGTTVVCHEESSISDSGRELLRDMVGEESITDQVGFALDSSWGEHIDLEQNPDVMNWDLLFADLDSRGS
jgi:hypothetical protein